MKILLALAFLLCISIGNALKCNACQSFKSWDECKSKNIEKNCSFTQDHCYAWYSERYYGPPLDAKLDHYIKGCFTSFECKKGICQTLYPSSHKCHLECCPEDLCNKYQDSQNEDLVPRTIFLPVNNTRSMVIYISVGFVTALLLLLSVAIFVWCYRRKRRRKANGSYLLQRVINPLDEWEILREQIEYEGELGRGAFGVVYKAILRERVGIEVFNTEVSERTLLSSKTEPQVVAVKVLHDNPSAAQKEEFQFEIEQMKLLGSHPNVVSFVGCCTVQDEKFLVIEYVPYGDLLTWLRCKRKRICTHQTSKKIYDNKEDLKDEGEAKDQDEGLKESRGEPLNKSNIPSVENQQHASAMPSLLDEDPNDEEESFSTQQLFKFAWQIAKGMNHLAEKNLVHRDLAARNVLVGHDNRVKVSDFGLMRKIYQDVINSEKSKKLPVKWMAPESLYQGTFSTKSDVWSYGVLLWEMATLGGVSYPTLTNTELYRLLNSGYRMEKPDMCCDEVYHLITECWREDPRCRPSFFQLIEQLEVIMQRDAPYLDVNKHNEAHTYYNVPPGVSADNERCLGPTVSQ